MEPFKLPSDLLLGTAASSLQIEGGDRGNNWHRFCEAGKVKDGTHCIVADDHWNRYEEDIRLMKKLNMQIYRMSIEWSRIEPKRGKYNGEAIKHYRSELELLLKSGIQPLVTLHHFSQPIWFEDMGGWESPQAVDCFAKYTEKAVLSFGDLVSDWVTINEPNYYLDATYSIGNFPPQKPGIKGYYVAMKNMIAAHIKAYKVLHNIRKVQNFPGKTLVGVANHVRVFDVEDKTPLNRFSCALADYNFHTLLMEGMMYGKCKFPIGCGNYPFGKGEFCDFFGLNYYSRDIVRFTLRFDRLFTDLTVRKGAEMNDMGWEIYPEGLYRVCKKYAGIYRKPIFITENGICDSKDKKRSKFIYDHLRVLKKLRDEGIDVKRYYHWSLLDNFEWDDGLTPRFGIVHVDYNTQKRTLRNSGLFFSQIARSHEVTREMINTYLVEQKNRSADHKP